MKQKNNIQIIRSILVAIGVAALLFAIVFLFREYASMNKDANDMIQTPSDVTHRILFISSYNPLYFTAEEQTKGLEEGLYPYGIEYDVAYLDIKTYPTGGSYHAFHDLLSARIAENDRNYEAVLVGDDAALSFVLEYRDELFPDLPVVFFGINELHLAEQAMEDGDITGLYEMDYLEETLKLAVSLFPDYRHIVALHDDSAAGASDMKIFFRFADEFPEYTFSDINSQKLSHQEFIDELEALPGDTIVIYMTCYTDRDDRSYSMREMTKVIADHADRLPIFRNYVGGEGDGILGGVALDFEEHTKMAGELVREVLEGGDIDKMELEMSTPSRCLFDYAQLVEWGVDLKKLPADTEYINRPETFAERYRAIFLPALLIVAALILFMISAGVTNRSMRRTNERLKANQDEMEKWEDVLRYQAEHDDFLDILNRRTMTERLNNELKANQVFSLVMADLDGFKEINEDYGHRQSDEILKYLVSIIKAEVDENGWLMARYGGDEFLFLIPNEQLSVEHAVTQKLLELFRTPIPVGDAEVSMSASLGISVSDGLTLPEQHVVNAEMAMYEAKLRGRDGAFLFADEMKERMREENRIKAKLIDAFENDGFYMVYQPQVNTKTKKVSGFEALVRMSEPGIYPGQFIPVAEKNGWIWKIGRITTELVIRQLSIWRDEGHALHPVSINYSSNQLNDTGYLEFLEELLKKYEIPPHLIEIEITEGLFLDRTAQAENLFDRFKELGIKLLMDDFGTGYSSLGYLTYIPVDVIKLDKSLVDAYLVDDKDSFVRDVIQLVHDLGKEMIIEGVEEEWQYERLKEFDADTIQGYYFSKPIPAAEAIVFKPM